MARPPQRPQRTEPRLPTVPAERVPPGPMPTDPVCLTILGALPPRMQIKRVCSTPVPQSFIVTPILPQHVRTVRAGIWNAARVPAAKVRSLHNRVGFLGPEAAARRIMNPPFVSTPSTAPDFIVWNVSTTATKWSIPLVGSTPPLPPLREAVTIPVGKTNIN